MAFGFEVKEEKKEIQTDSFLDVAVIASFKPNGEIKPLKIKIKTEQEEYVTFDIYKILYASYEGLDEVTNINYGIVLEYYKSYKFYSTKTIELIYIIALHQWKMKYLS